VINATWLGGLIRHRSARISGQVAGVAISVMLLASLGMFFAASRSRMTREAVAAVPVDWQIRLAPRTNAAAALRAIDSEPGVANALPVEYATTSGFRSSVGGAVRRTGSGQVLGMPSGYASTFPGEIRYLVGAHTGVLLAQQTAANLAAGVGSSVTVERPRRVPATVTVDGVVDLPAADSLFQSIGASVGTAPTAPPDNVMLLPASTWRRLFGRPGAPVEPGPGPGTVTQVHAGLSPALPTDPGAAFVDVVGRARNLEAMLAGRAVVGDNLAAQLDATRADAIYAELLFLFLGLPGVVLAGVLTAAVASTGLERRRSEQALLRIRGASPRRIVQLSIAEAAMTGVLAIAAGLAGAWLAGRLAFGVTSFGATMDQTIAWGIA
jgi:putative ABC transport system permease protein